jgi:hypothetical protein
MMMQRLLVAATGGGKNRRLIRTNVAVQRSLSSLSSTSQLQSLQGTPRARDHRPSFLRDSQTLSHINNVNSNGDTKMIRYFSRRVKSHLDDPVEEFLELEESRAMKERNTSVSAIDMEFFGNNSSDDGFDDDDDDDDTDKADPLYSAEYRKKQEETREELDSRTGRPWTDPWEITDEEWMSSTLQENLPDFSPELVSRISQERVRVYPGTLL